MSEGEPGHLEEHLARKKATRDWAAEKGRMYRQYMTTSVTGLEVGVSIALASMIGWWVDRKLGTAPWAMLFGLTVGMTHAGRILYALGKKHMLDNEEEDGGAEAAEPSTVLGRFEEAERLTPKPARSEHG